MDKYLLKPDTSNSMCKFVDDINQNFFRDTSPANNNTIKSECFSNSTKPNLHNKKSLPLSNAFPSKFRRIEKNEQKFSILPMPISLVKSSFPVETTTKSITKANQRSAPISEHKPTHNTPILITGRVEYVIKIYKDHPKIDALFEVYGKLIRIIKGKFLKEHLIFLRGNCGPVLQGTYYEFDGVISVEQGNRVKCVGKFNCHHKLQIFKITKMLHGPTDKTLDRLQTVCSYTLNKVDTK